MGNLDARDGRGGRGSGVIGWGKSGELEREEAKVE
jgi:hypothetical protein